jgi:predicted DNA-binding ribbon-helix-helix protein
MPPAFWQELKVLAEKNGMTPHNAIRMALVEWAAKKHTEQPR